MTEKSLPVSVGCGGNEIDGELLEMLDKARGIAKIPFFIGFLVGSDVKIILKVSKILKVHILKV